MLNAVNDPIAPPIKVYIVDDQAMLCRAFAALLNTHAELEVVGTNEDARAAVAEIRVAQADVVLLDVTMPGMSGIDAIEAVREASPRAKIVMLSFHEGESIVEQALDAGADGYVSKNSDDDELAFAIQTVHRGKKYVSPRVARVTENQEVRSPNGSLASLTRREREVFQLLALGKSNKEVAQTLEMSLGTAKKHRENLQRKLDCHSTAQLARLAIREGLLPS
jgi:DNA-binding NarL/FixJ family response regulator